MFRHLKSLTMCFSENCAVWPEFEVIALAPEILTYNEIPQEKSSDPTGAGNVTSRPFLK